MITSEMTAGERTEVSGGGQEGLPARLASIEVIASDYDRTLTALDLSLRPATVQAVDRASGAGIRIVIVSGRKLHFMARMSGMFERVDALVAENGAVISYNGRVRRLSEETGKRIADELEDRRVPIIRGDVISYVEKGNLEKARVALEGMGDYARLVRNVDSGMVLPTGVDKDSGLRVALELMGKRMDRTAVVGDGENDLSLFGLEALKVALGNSVRQIRERADVVYEKPGGEGVVEMIDSILSSRE